MPRSNDKNQKDTSQVKNLTLKYGAPLLCALSLLPAAASAAGTCPPLTPPRAAIDAQHRVGQIRIPPSDGGAIDVPPRCATLRAYKQALVATIDARLACSDEQVDPTTLKRTLATALGVPARPSSRKMANRRSAAIRTSTSSAAARPVRCCSCAPASTSCGDDNLLTAYAWENGGWRRVLRWQADDYKDIGGAYGGGFWFSALPGGQVAVVHGTSSCASRWSQFAADVVAPASGSTAQRAVFHSENSYVLDDNPIRFKVRPDGFEVRATVGSMDTT